MEIPAIPGRNIMLGTPDLVTDLSAATPATDTNNKTAGNSVLIAKYSLFSFIFKLFAATNWYSLYA
jgi:hypothetical protein